MARNLAYHLENVDHRGTAAYDPMEFKIAHQALLQILNSSAPGKLFGKVAERFFQVLAVDRLRKVVISAAFDRLDRGVDRVIPGHEDDVHPGVLVQSSLQKRQAIHTGHPEVTQDDTALATADKFQGLLRIRSSKAAMPETRKSLLEHL